MNKFMQIAQLVGAIGEIVTAVEKAVPIPKQGNAKLDAVLGIAKDAFGLAADQIPVATVIVNRWVALFNSIGTFKRTTR